MLKIILLALLFSTQAFQVSGQNATPFPEIKGWHIGVGVGAQISIKGPKANPLTDPLIAIPPAKGLVELTICFYPNERWGAFVTFREAYSSKPTSESFETALHQAYPDRYVQVLTQYDYSQGVTQTLFGARFNKSIKKLKLQPSFALGFSRIPLTRNGGTVKTPDSNALLNVSAIDNYEEKLFTIVPGCQLNMRLRKLLWFSCGLESSILFPGKLVYTLKTTDEISQQTQRQIIAYHKPFVLGNVIFGIHLQLN